MTGVFRSIGWMALLAVVLVLVRERSAPAEEAAARAASNKIAVLLLGDHGHHHPEALAKTIAPPLGKLGIDVTFTQDVKDLNAANLAKYDCLAIYGDSGDLPAAEERALMDYVDGGKGLVAIHCASHIFRNSQAYTSLVGGRFWKHETGVFRASIIDAQHPAMRGVKSFESWDETYVHNELSEDRQVLMARIHEGAYEPWTWVRKQGKGRVYYTASGHDERTWELPAYHALLAAGILWAAGRETHDAPRLEYESAGEGLPNYQPGKGWGSEGARFTEIQKPLKPADSIKHMHLPEGFHVELYAAEPDVVKPIAMNFDFRGRLWVLESTDYPNNVLDHPDANGADRIKICEDTTGSGKADKFTVFADKLNIPTGIGFARGGVLACVSPYMLFLKDTHGRDRADERSILLSGFGRGDTHGTHSNLHYGLDNWMYGSVGYDGGNIKSAAGMRQFHQGYFRFKSDGSDFEPLTTTSNNTWGLGINESGDIFGSTANGQHSVYLSIPNRYYEAVRGWHGNGSAGIDDHKFFHPVTDDVKQVDNFNGYTAAAGHELYTARSFPKLYWDHAAMVCEPTGHLVHLDWLVARGSGFVAKDGYDLMASSDSWTAPIAAQVGPDGAVWIIDWYSPVVQHNPTPHGFQTGAGAAFITPLRDKTHGRIYRIVAGDAKLAPYPKLDPNDPATLVAALSNDNMFWRIRAQQLLVERGKDDMLPKLAELVKTDAQGLAAVHALRSMQGLGAFAADGGPWDKTLDAGLTHGWPGVRRTALGCLPKSRSSTERIVAAKLLADAEPLVRKDALLALADLPSSPKAADAILAMHAESRNYEDAWIPTAIACAAAASDDSFLIAATGAKPDSPFRPALTKTVRVVAEHFARSPETRDLAPLLAALPSADPAIGEAVVDGLAAGWPNKKIPELSDRSIADLTRLLATLGPSGRPQVVALSQRWKLTGKFAGAAADVKKAMFADLADAKRSDAARINAAKQLVVIGLDAEGTAAILDSIGAKSSPELTAGLLESLGSSQLADIGPAIVAHWDSLTPGSRPTAIATLLSRPGWTTSLVEGLEKNKITPTELSLDQQQKLSHHADATLAARAQKALARGGKLPSADRQKVVDEFLSSAQRQGDAAKGKVVFEQTCIKCHRHGTVGAKIGPDLSGIAVRKKVEILVDVLDPNRSVEGNFQQYNLVDEDGRTFSGLLVSDNKTSVELLDAEGKRTVVLRENIDSLVNTKRSLMPEGFEKLGADGVADLLEFLAQRGKFLPLPLDKVATAISTQGMFYAKDVDAERLIFDDWEPKTAFGVPFHLVDPRGHSRPNVVMLYAASGNIPPTMPKSVSIPCNAPAKAIHLLSGVSGWGFPATADHSVSMIVRLHYAGGATEDTPLRNGEAFADYIHQVDVPGSKFAFKLRNQQIRYLAVYPQKKDTIETIELVKGPDNTAPVVMAVTVETGE